MLIKTPPPISAFPDLQKISSRTLHPFAPRHWTQCSPQDRQGVPDGLIPAIAHCSVPSSPRIGPRVTQEIAAPLPATEQVSPRYRDLDAWAPASILATLWESQLAAAAATRAALPMIEAAAEAALPRLAGSGRLVYAGAGTSGRIGVQDGAELPPTFNWPEQRLVLLMAGGDAAFTRAIENAEDDRQAAINAIAANNIGPADVVLGIAASGSTPFTVAAIAAARQAGALTIGIANSPDGAVLRAAECPILVETGRRGHRRIDPAEGGDGAKNRA